MSLWWVPISCYPSRTRVFEIEENSNLYPNVVKAEKIRQIEFGSDGYPRI